MFCTNCDRECNEIKVDAGVWHPDGYITRYAIVSDCCEAETASEPLTLASADNVVGRWDDRLTIMDGPFVDDMADYLGY